MASFVFLQTSTTWMIFLARLNGIHPTIKFARQYSEQQQVNFLDTMVFKSNDGSLSVKIFVKETDRNYFFIIRPSILYGQFA